MPGRLLVDCAHWLSFGWSFRLRARTSPAEAVLMSSRRVLDPIPAVVGGEDDVVLIAVPVVRVGVGPIFVPDCGGSILVFSPSSGDRGVVVTGLVTSSAKTFFAWGSRLILSIV